MQNTCKTNNPNYINIDPSLLAPSTMLYGRYSIKYTYWNCVLNGFSDFITYDCDDSDCDHEYCVPIDVFNINRVDRLLFPELENYSQIYIWNSEYTGIGYELIPDDHPMPVYALGL